MKLARRMITAAVAGIALAAGVALAATPAMAASSPPSTVTTNVVVGTTLQLTLSSNTVSFGTLPAGAPFTAPTGGNPAFTATINTNTSNSNLTWTPPSPDNFGSSAFPVTPNLQVEAPAPEGTGSFLDAGATQGLASYAGPQMNSVVPVSLQLQTPAGLAAGSYSAAFTLTLSGS